MDIQLNAIVWVFVKPLLSTFLTKDVCMYNADICNVSCVIDIGEKHEFGALYSWLRLENSAFWRKVQEKILLLLRVIIFSFANVGVIGQLL